MAKKDKTKFITKDILKSSIIGAFQKLDLRYMVKNPVMFVVDIDHIAFDDISDIVWRQCRISRV